MMRSPWMFLAFVTVALSIASDVGSDTARHHSYRIDPFETVFVREASGLSCSIHSSDASPVVDKGIRVLDILNSACKKGPLKPPDPEDRTLFDVSFMPFIGLRPLFDM